MSAAATAAGYLYASGRLRGRGAPEKERKELHLEGRETRVAVYDPEAPPRAERPKRVPKVEYRVRRWKPGDHE
jgi:hypothetical protein